MYKLLQVNKPCLPVGNISVSDLITDSEIKCTGIEIPGKLSTK